MTDAAEVLSRATFSTESLPTQDFGPGSSVHSRSAKGRDRKVADAVKSQKGRLETLFEQNSYLL